ncbi:MAG: protein jag [Clostridia bacterium]|nr:protein jag [Clostridia bacterium]
MDFSEKWGTDVETAVQLALQDLKLTRDEVDVTVLEEPSRGFFGIGAKLALVRVEKKKEEEKVQEKIEEVKEVPVAPAEKKEEAKPARAFIDDVKEEDLVPVEEHEALTFLREVASKMGLELTITAKEGKENIFIDIEGKDSGTVIGKRGQTLDAIQYLTSLVVNKDKDKHVRVVVDAENYRAKREKTLMQLANRLADKVYKTRRSIKLEPMNPYERKVIHATLQSSPYVTTRSEGQDPYRRVIIELK